jgi:two-component system NarL family response regulator
MSEQQEPAPISVLVIEDNYVMRLGTVTLLGAQPDLRVVGEAEGGVRGIELARTLRPDVVVADLRMPDVDGVGVASTLGGEDPPLRVLIFSHYASEQDVLRALRAGAFGYVTKEVQPDAFLAAVRAVGRGQRFLPPELSGKVAAAMSQTPLTPREREVLALLARGLQNPAIATALGITERTTVMHVSNILAKLEARTRTEAVARAHERGLLPDR